MNIWPTSSSTFLHNSWVWSCCFSVLSESRSPTDLLISICGPTQTQISMKCPRTTCRRHYRKTISGSQTGSSSHWNLGSTNPFVFFSSTPRLCSVRASNPGFVFLNLLENGISPGAHLEIRGKSRALVDATDRAARANSLSFHSFSGRGQLADTKGSEWNLMLIIFDFMSYENVGSGWAHGFGHGSVRWRSPASTSALPGIQYII